MSKPLSRRSAAQYIGVAPTTLTNYERRGIGPRHVRFHGVCRYEISDLDAYLAARTVEAGQ